MTARLHAVFDDAWRHSLAYPLAGISVSSIMGWLTSPQVSVVCTALAVGITTIGGAVMGLRHQFRLHRLQEDMKRVELEMVRRKLRELPAEKLDPEAVGREAADPDGRAKARG